MKPAKWIECVPAHIVLLLGVVIGVICLWAFWEWLNTNQGAVMAVLMLVYVTTTIGILWYTRKSLLQALDFWREENRPFVIFELVCENRLVKSVRSNIGARPAYDVRVKVTPRIVTPNTGFRDSDSVSYENEVIPLLAPGRAIKDFLNPAHAFLRDNPALSFSVDISYRDSSREEYGETATVSLEYMRNLDIGGEDDSLRQIAEHMEHISRVAEKLAERDPSPRSG